MSASSSRTPAEAYAASRRRARSPKLAEFAAELSFELDPFQTDACAALEEGHGVLLCAPTGAGKTVVGEFAVHLALSEGRKCFYTTPIKALSNQKFADLTARYGAKSVGLLTGDTSVNGNAPVVVMTTEVLRNMLYARSGALEGLGYVVMDEVHYLADRFRGAVWEEVILHLPEWVNLVSLSATVSNAEEFGEWLVAVRGDTAVVVDEHRPVPLWQHMLVGNRMLDLFAGSEPSGIELRINPELVRRADEIGRHHTPWHGPRSRGGRGSGNGGPRFKPPSRVEVVERLDSQGLLPAIVFVFSRAGCEAAVSQCVRSGLRLNSEDEIAEVRRIVDSKTRDLPDADLTVLGFWEWKEALERGFAGHHAGLLPAFKETVEELFLRGLVKAVFATETLALGINMPARTVVLEKLVKYNGEAHVELTPGEYTQLTGRAGRRGIDVEGHAVVVWQPGLDPKQVAGLASTRTYPLKSSFRPGYNMAVNLVDRMGAVQAREILEQSFAQFQADRSVVGLSRRVERNREALAGYAESMTCHLGDFTQYAALRKQISDREKALSRQNSAARRNEAAHSLEQLRKGDVIAVPAGRRSGLAIVIDPGLDAMGEPRPLVVTEDRWAGRLSVSDFPNPVTVLGRVRLPKQVDVRSPRSRRDLASTLRAAGIELPPRVRRRTGVDDDADLAAARRALRAHPCHGCDDRENHARWAERYQRLLSETEQVERKVAATTHSLARAFDRIRGLLVERGYLAPGTGEKQGEQVVTEHGKRLARLYSESDLLAAECLRNGVWDRLNPAELAAVVSSLVFEARRDGPIEARVPGGAVEDALKATAQLWAELEGDERHHRLEKTRQPDPGFAWTVYRWVRGESLEKVITAADSAGQELSAGDFVRWCRQVIDLLDQIRDVMGEGSAVGATAREAVKAIRRGVVALAAA
ncbi:ATP-dependent RNA helicase HelY [Actinokineospora alba]|uniref:Probable helicase HelY n=1 Tax=Actinokineospora alba TaxID=504798 RepID=A0A1H0GHE0_9PSEU|nr:DEAD/DEAH box helicase [Actinokineospora alba]TDP69892.1 ATP-dependent RNA helicase HelY [Actinokineospora alba]SDI06461.1 ATP-dependent RNA helicase HelY [Actinokineospora alba]SDO06171.1 ATP-dependent RNA helicase HelY [Actinokineospora alba]